MLSKTYNCKNEELPVIARFLLFSLKRDLAEFAAFAPRFNEEYVTAFESKIMAVTEVMNPRTETVELKMVTERLYNAMDALLDPVARVKIYVAMSGSEIPVSVNDFGLPSLRLKIKSRDSEGVLACLKTVNSYIATFKLALMAQGLSEELIELFKNSASIIRSNNQLQYEIASGRKKLAENNMLLFNDLFQCISEVCSAGKIIYRKNLNTAKEYTFTELKKHVRTVFKSNDEK
jgi:hypothetical protein